MPNKPGGAVEFCFRSGLRPWPSWSHAQPIKYFYKYYTFRDKRASFPNPLYYFFGTEFSMKLFSFLFFLLIKSSDSSITHVEANQVEPLRVNAAHWDDDHDGLENERVDVVIDAAEVFVQEDEDVVNVVAVVPELEATGLNVFIQNQGARNGLILRVIIFVGCMALIVTAAFRQMG